MKRFSQRAAWGIADWLTTWPQTEAVTWWTAALLRFAMTGEKVIITRLSGERQPLTKNEIETLRNAIRPLDCGHHYCRYCDAGTHNQWQHSANCPYGLSVTDVDAAKAILEKLLPICALTGNSETKTAEPKPQR